MMNFALKQHHGWAIDELENMMPFERELYIHLLKQHLEDERVKAQERAARAKANGS
jgi:hypothetical protein